MKKTEEYACTAQSENNPETPGKYHHTSLLRSLADVSSSSCSSINDACDNRIEVLNEELEAKKKEHLKDMEIKKLKIFVLEKLKYWKKKNENM